MFKLEILNMELASDDAFRNACLTMANRFLVMAGEAPVQRDEPAFTPRRSPSEVFGQLKQDDSGVTAPPEAVRKPQEPVKDFSYLRGGSTDDPELDTAGVRWDKEIHTRTKSRDDQGRWKVKRGLEAPPPPEAKSLDADVYDVTQELTFASLMRRITTAIKDKLVTREDISSLAHAQGMPSIGLVAQKPELLPAIEEGFNKLIGVKRV